ncbi:MAG: ATP-binding protein [Candidatus Jordarchaeum sp.]|uniref:ATP-binding protein n=1 Tax=Candidatus Jordarchaeum sp. TaxID=2823881 RepID=UPI00404977DD
MKWIVLGENKGRIELVSKSETPGLLPKGSYLTIESNETKFILRVDDSLQVQPYSPLPMIVDMDLSPLDPDKKCQNIIYAYRVKDLTQRNDGLIDFIQPMSVARRSNQEEIDLAMGSQEKGPKVFIATVHAGQNQLLIDDQGRAITASLPEEMFYHQMLICGKTGSGKTVAAKYLAQYFVEELEGAVLAINVKDVDFLKMDQESKVKNPLVLKEWEMLNQEPHGIYNFTVYYPANTKIDSSQGVTPVICKKITLDVHEIDPESLTGLLYGISDIGAQNLPNIFRYWQEQAKSGKREPFTFSGFVNYFTNATNREFNTLNTRGEESWITLHRGTFDNIQRNLNYAVDFFDNEDAIFLREDEILEPGKMSVINVAGAKGIQFGSILLRHLLKKIVEAKSMQKSKVPILIIIDEVHQFYNTESSREALGDLDTICRTGRSQKIGVIFSSQNPSDIPRGLSSVINTKIFFKSDAVSAKLFGVNVTDEEIESLKKGFAVATIHDLSQLKILKFPLAFAGVFE